MKICVIGAGYVGLPTAACLSEHGNTVYCYETNKEKISMLNDHIIPIYEPDLEHLVKKNLSQKRIFFSSSIVEAINEVDIIFICVGTPQMANGEPDLSYIWNCADELKKNIYKDVIIVVKSTVPVGTSYKIYEYLQEGNKLNHSGSLNLEIAFCPEFLKQGCAVADTMRPDRIIIGCDSENAKKVLQKLYDSFTLNHSRTIFMPVKDAEMTKYVANAMLATRISFMNEMSLICDAIGVDIECVRKGIGSDSRIGYSFLYAGIGYGGSCFPKDINALISLANKNGIECSILESVHKRNLSQKKYILKKIFSVLGKNLENSSFMCWGIAFKPETDDLREAPSLEIITELINYGATVFVYDPVAYVNILKYFPSSWIEDKKLVIVDDMYKNIEKINALILLTEWKSFRNPDLKILKEYLSNKFIFDGRNQLDPVTIENLGIAYYGIGRGRC